MENEKKMLVEITTKAFIDEDDCVVTESSVEGKCTTKMFVSVLCQSFLQIANAQGIPTSVVLAILGAMLEIDDEDEEE